MRIAKGLIIAAPWIDYILSGTKDWEMRSTGTSHRGWFALIRKGSGAIYGVARLTDAGARQSAAEMVATISHHRIPEPMIRSGEVAKWNTPWKLADVRRFEHPVPYSHKSGAVTWVELDDAAVNGVARQIDAENLTVIPKLATPSARRNRDGVADTVAANVLQRDGKLLVETRGGGGELEAVTVSNWQSAPAPARPVKIPLPAGATADVRLVGEVEITEGNIANNHIYLRSFFDRFPAEAVGGSNKSMAARRNLTIEWGGAEPVLTDLDGQKKFFRARGWIGAFYQLHQARAGDRVLVEEVAPYRYRVSLRRLGSRGGL